MTEPAARNSRPLKKAWVIRWKIPAEYAANTAGQKHVSQLRDSGICQDLLDVGLRHSYYRRESAVMQPMMATTINALGARLKITLGARNHVHAGSYHRRSVY